MKLSFYILMSIFTDTMLAKKSKWQNQIESNRQETKKHLKTKTTNPLIKQKPKFILGGLKLH